MRIYLDVCCLNRPFDDQTQDRIHLKAEAILTILKFVEHGQWFLLNSDGIFYEINKIPDPERKSKIQLIISKACEYIRTNDRILARAEQIQKLSIKSYDALHIASAESGKADIFLTTDDLLLNKMRKHVDKIKLTVRNPLDWIKEVI